MCDLENAWWWKACGSNVTQQKWRYDINWFNHDYRQSMTLYLGYLFLGLESWIGWKVEFSDPQTRVYLIKANYGKVYHQIGLTENVEGIFVFLHVDSLWTVNMTAHHIEIEYQSDDVTKNFFLFQHFEYYISVEHDKKPPHPKFGGNRFIGARDMAAWISY